MNGHSAVAQAPHRPLRDAGAPGTIQQDVRAPEAAIDPETSVLLSNKAEFNDWLSEALASRNKGRFVSAAAFAVLAAQAASHRHPGTFSSPRLEQLLLDLGRSIPDTSNYRRKPSDLSSLRRVLHVCSQLVDVGGHTKMLGRWIRVDADRSHSIVLTTHRGPIPSGFQETVEKAGGQLHRLNQGPGDLFAWARRLRDLAREADVVILHIGNQDVVPLLAFADPARVPPLLFLNHSDHLFWLGTSISDGVINLRDAAAEISLRRRGVEERRNFVVPTLVDVTVRRHSRAEAKKALGIPADEVLILSAARGVKYRTVDDVTFADTHVPVLQMYPQARLLVLGAGPQPDWRPAMDATGGRIQSLAPVSDPSLYYEAADIYVDSYPFVSSTSMMEAAGYGLPMVTRFYGPDDAKITAINHPGLMNSAIHSNTDSHYTQALAELIADPQARERRGAAAREEVARLHEPAGWLSATNEAFAKTLALPPVDSSGFLANAALEQSSFGEPDRRINPIFGDFYSRDDLLAGYLGLFPAADRLPLWNRVRRAKAFRNRRQMLGLLLPEWAVRALEGWIRLS